MEKNKTEIYLKVNKTAKTRNKPNNNKLQSLVAASSAAGAKRGLLFAIRQTQHNRRQTNSAEEEQDWRWTGWTGKLCQRESLSRKFAQLKVLRMQQ